jgi:hypothetical protein
MIGGPVTDKPDSLEKSITVVVNAHGALVEMSVSPEQGSIVKVKNIRTNDEQEAKVILVSPGETGKFNVALEFTGPNPGFWRVIFPPSDWSMRHADAKRN